jgi:acyl carrier protein
MTPGERTEERLVLDVVSAFASEMPGGPRLPVLLNSDLRSDLGFDSLAIVELAEEVGNAAGVVLGEEVLARARTPRDLVSAVRSADRRHPQPSSAHVGMPKRHASGSERRIYRADAGATAASTLTEALALHASCTPDQVTLHLVGSAQGGIAEAVTYGELLVDAQRAARALTAEGLDFGERVAIILPTGRAYFTAFCGVRGWRPGSPVSARARFADG